MLVYWPVAVMLLALTSTVTSTAIEVLRTNTSSTIPSLSLVVYVDRLNCTVATSKYIIKEPLNNNKVLKNYLIHNLVSYSHPYTKSNCFNTVTKLLCIYLYICE